MSLALVDGEPVVLRESREEQVWRPRTALRLVWKEQRVALIRDYVHCEYMLEHAVVEPIS